MSVERVTVDELSGYGFWAMDIESGLFVVLSPEFAPARVRPAMERVRDSWVTAAIYPVELRLALYERAGVTREEVAKVADAMSRELTRVVAVSELNSSLRPHPDMEFPNSIDARNLRPFCHQLARCIYDVSAGDSADSSRTTAWVSSAATATGVWPYWYAKGCDSPEWEGGGTDRG